VETIGLSSQQMATLTSVLLVIKSWSLWWKRKET